MILIHVVSTGGVVSMYDVDKRLIWMQFFNFLTTFDILFTHIFTDVLVLDAYSRDVWGHAKTWQ
jgi:hypothetical protein